MSSLPTAFSLYCDKHNIDRLAQKQIRLALRVSGFRAPYDLSKKEIMAIIEARWQSIQVTRYQRLALIGNA